ncbi:MAG: hypothetical protein L3J51_02230 [Cocleimonas sp.]|nr:hypothetical protein [Cocleimonas sp.]
MTMKDKMSDKKCLFKISGVLSIVCAFVLITTPVYAEKDRFKAPEFNTGLDNFNKRFSSNNVNIDFIVAQVLNNARQIDRAADGFRRNASLFRNESNGDTNAGSVVVPPGTRASTIIIINQNDGDSIAIHR